MNEKSPPVGDQADTGHDVAKHSIGLRLECTQAVLAHTLAQVGLEHSVYPRVKMRPSKEVFPDLHEVNAIRNAQQRENTSYGPEQHGFNFAWPTYRRSAATARETWRHRLNTANPWHFRSASVTVQVTTTRGRLLVGDLRVHGPFA